MSRHRKFDGENTWFYFLWYGLGRFWIEGLRTDSLYLFDLTFLGERVRVSQALSLVMIVLTAVILLIVVSSVATPLALKALFTKMPPVPHPSQAKA